MTRRVIPRDAGPRDLSPPAPWPTFDPYALVIDFRNVVNNKMHAAAAKSFHCEAADRSILLWNLDVPLQPVELHADMRRLGGSIGERDSLVEGGAGFVGAAELHEQRALEAEEMKIAGERLGQRLDQRQRRGRAFDLAGGDGAIERDDRRPLQALPRGVELGDLPPIRT